MHGNNDGLKRLFNYYRIKRRLQQPIAAHVCPVCIQPECKHKYEYISGKDGKELLDWWLGVIEMEIKHDDHIIKDVPNMVIRSQLTFTTRTILIDGELAVHYGNKIYTKKGKFTTDTSTNLARYGNYKNGEFKPFAAFFDGFINPIKYNNQDGKPLYVPMGTIPCYDWGVKWVSV